LLKVHTRDGETINLTSEEVRSKTLQKNQNKLSGVTAIQTCGGHLACPNCNSLDEELVCQKGIQFSLPKPLGFERIKYDVDCTENGNEKIICVADDCKIVVTVNKKQPSAKIVLIKRKKVQRFDPSDNRCE
jgi:hypothetical protein